MSEYTEYVSRQQVRYPGKFSESDLPAKFRPFLRSGQRIRVSRVYSPDETYTRTGTVGVTTGHKPAFLLMRRASDHGSSDVLSDKDTITHVQYGRTYVPVQNLPRDPNNV